MIDRALELLSGRNRILVFTGAGMSTASGIPDFRGPDGVWTKIDPAEFTYERYLTRPEVRRKAWQRRGPSVLDATPNAAHRAVVDLYTASVLEACVTQNIDGLHAKAGLPSDVVVELHGNAARSRCLDCGRSWDTREILERVAGGDGDPHCEHCGGIIKPAVISFGEPMPFEEMERAYRAADSCDAVVAAGSTLAVFPAADVPARAARRGVPYIVVNQGETGHDQLADARVEGDVTAVLPQLASLFQ